MMSELVEWMGCRAQKKTMLKVEKTLEVFRAWGIVTRKREIKGGFSQIRERIAGLFGENLRKYGPIYLCRSGFMPKSDRLLCRVFSALFHRKAFQGLFCRDEFHLLSRRPFLHKRPLVFPSVFLIANAFLLFPTSLFAETIGNVSLLKTVVSETSSIGAGFFQPQSAAGTILESSFVAKFSSYAVCAAIFLLFILLWGVSSRRSFSRERCKTIRSFLNSLPYPAWFKDRRLRFVAANKEFLTRPVWIRNKYPAKGPWISVPCCGNCFRKSIAGGF